MKIKGTHIIMSALLILFFGVLFWFFVLPWIPIKTAIAYPALRKQWDPITVAHFPEKKPEGTKSAAFYFNWGYAQAPKVMEWRVIFNESSFPTEIQRLSSISETDDGRRNGPTYDSLRYRTVQYKETGFDPRILHARPTMNGNEPDWNHGETYGYAVRTSSREIVYWIESW